MAFVSNASDLVEGDTNGMADIFLFDRAGSLIRRPVRGFLGEEPNGASSFPALSFDGSFLTFESEASNLRPADLYYGHGDVYILELNSGSLELVSVTSEGLDPGGGESDWYGWGGESAVSDDGRYVLFSSTSSGLVAGDTNYRSDIFLRDRRAQCLGLCP